MPLLPTLSRFLIHLQALPYCCLHVPSPLSHLWWPNYVVHRCFVAGHHIINRDVYISQNTCCCCIETSTSWAIPGAMQQYLQHSLSIAFAVRMANSKHVLLLQSDKLDVRDTSVPTLYRQIRCSTLRCRDLHNTYERQEFGPDVNKEPSIIWVILV